MRSFRNVLSDLADYLDSPYETRPPHLWTRFYCRWLLTAPACAIKGHDWREEHLCLARGAKTCARCGHFQGAYGKPGRNKCSRAVSKTPASGGETSGW